MADKKIRVLIVDDQALILDLLSKGLSKDPGLEIVGTATDGYLAINMINRVKPDVVILDMEMPRMNGIQFLHNLMPVNPIPTIVLSALTQSDSRITLDAFESGAVDFLAKPSGGAHALQALMVQLSTKIRIAVTQDVSHFRKAKENYRLPPSTLDRKAKTDKIILGMGAFDVTNDSGKCIKIFALGSCIGLAMFCASNGTIGLSHIALPNSNIDQEKADRMPGYFADTAITILLDKMLTAGCYKEKIYAKIAGGAKTRIEIADHFGIGQRNTVAVKAGLLKKGVKLIAEDVGGQISRTIAVEVGNNKMSIYYPEKGTWEI